MTQHGTHGDARLQAGYRAQDYRASRARAYRRRDNAEAVEVCWACGTEVDVPQPVHDASCAAAARKIGDNRGPRAHTSTPSPDQGLGSAGGCGSGADAALRPEGPGS